MFATLLPRMRDPRGSGAGSVASLVAVPRFSGSMSATEDRAAAKARLFAAISSFDEVRSQGGVNVDFGVKGGELDKESRAPRNLADGGFYAVSEEVGRAADGVLEAVEALVPLNPTPDPTRYLGTAEGTAGEARAEEDALERGMGVSDARAQVTGVMRTPAAERQRIDVTSSVFCSSASTINNCTCTANFTRF